MSEHGRSDQAFDRETLAAMHPHDPTGECRACKGTGRATEPPAPPETAPPLDLALIRDILGGKAYVLNLDDKSPAEAYAPVLLAEVARLRGLLERVVDLDRTHFDPGSGGCPFCGIKVSWNEHDTGCPWPELEAAVLSWRKP